MKLAQHLEEKNILILVLEMEHVGSVQSFMVKITLKFLKSPLSF